MTKLRRAPAVDSGLTPGILAHFEAREHGTDSTLFFENIDTNGETFARLWARVRDDVLGRWQLDRPGHRPEAWWVYDAKAAGCVRPFLGRWPSPEAETAYLLEHGVLSTEEIRRLGSCLPEGGKATNRRQG